MNFRTMPYIFAIAVALGCGEDSTGDSGGAGGEQCINCGGGAGEGGAGGGVGTREETRERLSFVKKVSDESGDNYDLFVYDFDLDDEINLTEGIDEVDCGTRSCKLSDGQEWVGWLARQPNGSFNLMIAPVLLDQNRIDLSAKFQVGTDVDSFDFTKDESTTPATSMVIFSRVQGDGSGRKEIVARPTRECGDCEILIGSVNSDGGYRVTSYSGLFILIETTLSSMTVRLFNLGTMSQQNIAYFGVENETGSQYSATDPIALAPSAEYLAIFTRDNFLWKLNSVEARPDAPEPTVHELFETSTARSGTCMRMGNYSFQAVLKDPIISNDSEWIYFLAGGECSGNNRRDYDVLRMNRNLSGAVENVTNIGAVVEGGVRRVNDWISHDISSFAINGDETRLIFDGQRPNNARSKSLWLIDPTTGDYDCSRGRSQRTPFDSKPRCEFIFDERSDVSVSYLNVRFHSVNISR